MKILGIGDLFIPCEYIEKGMSYLSEYGAELKTIQWELRDFDELQAINLNIEQGGRETFSVPEYILEAAADADIIITQFCPVNKAFIDRAPNLKCIGVLRAGYENIAVDYAAEKGISVLNTPGRNAEAVSDFTIGMIICEARNIARGHYGIKRGQWIRKYPNSDDIPDLGGRTLGIIGYGEVGWLVAKKIKGFDMRVLVYDPYYKGTETETVSLDTLLTESDFVTLHARLTDLNTHMIGARELGLMKKTAYLINTSRSGLVDEAALYSVLRDKKIAGAALDVFDTEPPVADYPLVTLDNVTLTPHMAGGSQDAFRNTPKKLAKDIENVLLGRLDACRYLIRKG